jgi:WD40 repeat protein
MLAGLCLSAPLLAEGAAPKNAPAKQKLAFPIAAGAAPSIECVVTFGPPACVSALAFSPDGQTLAAGGYQEVLLWDLAAAKLAKRIGAGQLTGPVRALAYVDEGRSLAVGEAGPSASGAVKVFDVQTGKLSVAFKEPKEAVYALARSPDGALLAAGCADAMAYVWSIKDKKLVTTLKDHGDWVLGVAFSPDGKQLATASADRTLMTWEVGTWTRLASLKEAEPIGGAAFSADGMQLAAVVGGPGEWSIRIRRLDDPKSPAPKSAPATSRAVYTGEGMPQGMAWAAKTGRIYAACSDKTVKALRVSEGTIAATLRGHADWVYAVALSLDEGRLASGSADGTVRLWNAADGRPLATLVQLAPRTDQWLIITPSGYLVSSSPSAIEWKIKGLTAPPQDPTAFFSSAESVQKVMAGQDVAPPALK